MAREAAAVARTVGDLAILRAQLWVWRARSYVDPSFRIDSVRAEVKAAVGTFRDAGDVRGLLDALEVLSILDLNVAHWSAAAATARDGIGVATEHGFDSRRSEFARWVANALVWGNSDATESIAAVEGLIRTETSRGGRSAMIDGLGILRALVGDAEGAEAAAAEAAAFRQELGARPNRFRYMFAQYALGNLPGALEASRLEAAQLERIGETGQRSTCLALQGWLLALMGKHEEAVRAAEEGRLLGSTDDGVTQILWRTGAGLANARLGNLELADRLSSEAVEVAATTDSISAADAWESRARVLDILGRREQMVQAARRARELHAAKGSVNFLRRLHEFLSDAGVDLEAAARTG
jgi:hypothetical protein